MTAALRPGPCGLGVAAGVAAAAGAAYWLAMSPFSQAFGDYPYRGEPSGGAGKPGTADEKVIALTFDDGPNEPYTSSLADLLESRDVRATFFQVGKAVLRYPDITRRLVDSGHVIGCHGFTHEFTKYLTRRSLAPDVRQGMDALETVGVRPALYRPPWLLRIPSTQAVIAKEGLRPVLGEFCHSLEVFQPRPEMIADGAVSKARPGSIIIFHDGWDGHEGNRASTVAAAEIVIDRLRDEGYRFVTVDEMLNIPAYQ